MSDAERRLVDDPSAPDALRRALKARASETLPSARREALRASIAGSIAGAPSPAPAPLPSRLPWIVAGVSLTLLAGVALWGIPGLESTTTDSAGSEAVGASAPSVRPDREAPLVAQDANAQPPPVTPRLDGDGQAGTEAMEASERRAPRRAAAVAPTTPEDEIALINEARQALRGGQPGRSLALLRRHRRRFAHGLLVQEREVLAIEALMEAGATRSAQGRASRFLRRYPHSALGPRVQQLVDIDANDNSSSTR